MSKFKPVPVASAKMIADKFSKSQVVIMAFDPEHKATATATYGVTAFDKENAAAAGEFLAKQLGNDLAKKVTLEDFHKDYDPASAKAMLECLQWLFKRRACPPFELQRIEETLKTAGIRYRHG